MADLPFYVFAWICSIFYGLASIVGKLTSKHSIRNPWLFNFFLGLFILIFTIPVALYFGAGIPAKWPSVIAAGFFAALAQTFFVLALYGLDVSVITPLFNFRNVFAALLGVLLLGEALSGYQVGLIAFIFLAGFFVSIDERFSWRSFFSRSIFIGLLCMLFGALMAMFVKIAVAENGFWTASLWMGIILQVLFLTTWPKFHREAKEIGSRQMGVLVAMSLLSVVGDLAAEKAYSLNVSLSAVIISAPISMFLAFLFAYFAPELLEKHTFKVYLVRFVAAVAMIAAALQLT